MRRENDWEAAFALEIERAETARNTGNEGMARVCARRAAGIVAAEYMQRRGIAPRGSSAYDHLRYLCTLPELPQEISGILEHFILRINTDHRLPVDADLIAEAHWFARQLL